MDITYHAVNHDLRPEERERIERELGRVGEFLKQFPRPSYHVEIEHSARKGGHGVSVHVNLSTRSLFATAWGSDLRSGAEAAVDKLVRQAKKHLDRLRKDERAGAETPRAESFFPEPTVEDLKAVRDLEDFKDQIATHSARLHKYLRRELRLLKRGGRVATGVSLSDVVEDALVYVFEHFDQKPKELSPDRWLIRRGLLFLHEALDQAEKAESAHEPSRTIEEEPEDWEELMGLSGPESVPMDGHLAEDAQADPEKLRDRGDAQVATAEALAKLPSLQRQSVLLRHLEGYRIPEIAYVLNTDEPQVEQWLDEAEVALQGRLKDWRRL
jgi:RNA polymerase sigma factor (sigma-70 family)